MECWSVLLVADKMSEKKKRETDKLKDNMFLYSISGNENSS